MIHFFVPAWFLFGPPVLQRPSRTPIEWRPAWRTLGEHQDWTQHTCLVWPRPFLGFSTDLQRPPLSSWRPEIPWDLQWPPETSRNPKSPLVTTGDLRWPPETSRNPRRHPVTTRDLRGPVETSRKPKRPPVTTRDFRRQGLERRERPLETPRDLSLPPEAARNP